MGEQFSLKWNNYQISLTSAFKHILEEEDFVDVTLSAEGQSLKAHKVVLSACSQYFKNLLKGISLWQHPVLVLKDVRFIDLQSILEFIYLGEVNLEQARLDSFLNTAEILQIKGLTDGLRDQQSAGIKKVARTSSLEQDHVSVGKHKLDSDVSQLSQMAEKKLKTEAAPVSGGTDPLETAGEWSEVSDNSMYSGEHIMVAGEPVVSPMQITRESYLKVLMEDLGPLHKRCPVCNMVMLKKNMSRHIRDQHSVEKPRSVCPLCGKTYKTADWLKDHIRRGHNYSKEETAEIMVKLQSGEATAPNTPATGAADTKLKVDSVMTIADDNSITTVNPNAMEASVSPSPPYKLEISTNE